MGLFGKSKEEKNQNNEGLIVTYTVVYKGGHPEYPKAKVSGLKFSIFDDRFEIQPTNAAKWFTGLVIPYNQIKGLRIVERQVSTAEGLLGGINSRQLNQPNNINIEYLLDGQTIILRLEMLSGITVMGQAGKCRELEDRLNTNNIRQKFMKDSTKNQGSSENVVDQIRKLSELRDSGILTEEEFTNAKSKLLN